MTDTPLSSSTPAIPPLCSPGWPRSCRKSRRADMTGTRGGRQGAPLFNIFGPERGH